MQQLSKNILISCNPSFLSGLPFLIYTVEHVGIQISATISQRNLVFYTTDIPD